MVPPWQTEVSQASRDHPQEWPYTALHKSLKGALMRENSLRVAYDRNPSS